MKSVQDIIDDLNRDSAPVAGSEKTASTAPNGSPVETAREELRGSLQALLGGDQTKEASTSETATAHLEKVASDLAEADSLATIKEARLYGSAVFDGFIARANQFATASGSQPNARIPRAKTAAEQEGAMIKQAATEGYHAMDRKLAELGATVSPVEKTAAQKQAEYEEGILAGLDKVAEHSIDCFERGFEHMSHIATRLAG